MINVTLNGNGRQVDDRPIHTSERRRMLREIVFHTEAAFKETWSQTPIEPGDNGASYADMLNDPTVAYCIGLIQDAICAGEWHLEPAKKIMSGHSSADSSRSGSMALEIERNLRDIDVEAALHDALDAIWRGFRAHEITWDYRAGRHVLESLAAIDPDQIALELDDRMRVTAVLSKPVGHDPQRLPREKIWMHVHNPSRTRPAGESVLEPVYRAWSSKNRLLQFWGLSIQRFGMTHMIVRIPANTPPGEQANLLATLYQGRLDGVYLLKEQYTVEVLNPTQWANLTFEAAIDYQDSEIVKGLLYMYQPGGSATGQTYVTGAGLGEQARATAARLQRISRALARSFTMDVIAPLCKSNWGTELADVPRLVLPIPDTGRIATLAAPLASLVSAGIADPATAAEQIGLPEPTIKPENTNEPQDGNRPADGRREKTS